LWMAMAGSEIYGDVLDGEYGSTSYPVTGLIVAALRTPLMLIGQIMVIYYGAELFWREHRYRMSSILATTPVPGSVMIASKWTALTALVGALVGAGSAVGIVLQVANGYWNFE